MRRDRKNRLIGSLPRLSIAFGAALLVASADSSATARFSSTCDRSCLIGAVTQYVAAVAHHRPEDVPLSPYVKYTENGVIIPIGDGLWQSLTATSETYRIFAADSSAGEVALASTGIEGGSAEGNKPVSFTIRLKIQNGQIIEAEHIVNRRLPKTGLPNLIEPRDAFISAPSSAAVLGRDELIHYADEYFDALEKDDASRAQVARGCQRFVDGVQVSGLKAEATGTPEGEGLPGEYGRVMRSLSLLDCGQQIDAGVSVSLTSANPRRYIVDPVSGLVFALVRINFQGKSKSETLKGHPSLRLPNKTPSSGYCNEILKIDHRQIVAIEAVGCIEIPYLMAIQ